MHYTFSSMLYCNKGSFTEFSFDATSLVDDFLGFLVEDVKVVVDDDDVDVDVVDEDEEPLRSFSRASAVALSAALVCKQTKRNPFNNLNY